MSTLWTPSSADYKPKVRPELDNTTREWEHSVLSMMHASSPLLDSWNTELAKIDPFLRLMQASERAFAPGVVAGYYHLVRLRDPATMSFMWVAPLLGPNNEFVEPNSAMLESLRASDLQNERAVDARRRADAVASMSKDNALRREEEDRLDEGVERLNAVTRTQILTSLDVPWSQNNGPTARRDRGNQAKKKAAL